MSAALHARSAPSLRPLGGSWSLPWPGGLRLVFGPGAALTADDLDAFCALRRSAVRFKPDLDSAADERGVRAFAQDCHLVCRVVDDGGRWVGSAMSQRHEPRGGDGPLCFQIDYGYAHPDYRGHGAFAVLQGLFGCRLLIDGAGREAWLIGIGAYPYSYRTLRTGLAVCGPSLDPAIPAWLGQFIDEQARRQCGPRWDSGRHLVNLNTLPQPLPPALAARFEGEGWWREYLAHCPQWEQGVGLALYARVQPADLVRHLKTIARRSLSPRVAKGRAR